MKINLYKITLTLSLLLLATESPVISKPKPQPNEVMICNQDVPDATNLQIFAVGSINKAMPVPKKGKCEPQNLTANLAKLKWKIVNGNNYQDCTIEPLVKDTSKATVMVKTTKSILPSCQVVWKIAQ